MGVDWRNGGHAESEDRALEPLLLACHPWRIPASYRDPGSGPEGVTMAAPVFTEAELRRAMKVAAEFGASVEVVPRKGMIRIIAQSGFVAVPSPDTTGDEEQCDAAFGMGG